MTSPLDDLQLSWRDGVATLRLNRPAKRNALSQAMLAALPDLLAQAAASPEVRVLIVTGGAGHAFSAGADIDEFEAVYATPQSAAAFANLFVSARRPWPPFPSRVWP